MSPTSGGGERLTHAGHDANGNALQVSNVTSGYFLGTVRRSWMLNGGSSNPLSAANQRTATNTFTQPTNVASTLSDNVVPIQAANQVLSPASGLSPLSPGVDVLTTTLLPNAQEKSIIDVPTSLEVAEINGNGLNADSNIEYIENVVPNNDGASAADKPHLSLGSDGRPSTILTDVPTSPAVLTTASQSLQPRGALTTPSADRIVTDSSDRGPLHHQVTSPSTAENVATFRWQEAPRPIQWEPLNTSVSSTSSRSPVTLPPAASPGYPIQQPQARPAIHNAFVNPYQQSHEAPPNAPADTVAQPQILEAMQSRNVRALDNQINMLAATKMFNNFDGVRIMWLRTACAHGDTFYMTLHQLCCVHAIYPNFLATKLAFLPFHIESLLVLSCMPSDTRRVTADLLGLFCNFPTPIAMVESDAYLRPWISTVKKFLEGFTQRWEALKTKVFHRGCPPSAREITMELGIHQYVLSQVIFIDFFHQLFPNSNKAFYQASFELFTRSRDLLLNSLQQRVNNAFQQTVCDQEIRGYLSEFYALRQRYQQHLLPAPQLRPAASGSASQTPTRGRVGAGSAMNTSIPINVAMVNHGRRFMNHLGQSNILTASSTMAQPLQSIPPNGHPAAPPLFPASGQLLSTTVNPNPSRIALHQAHLSVPLITTATPPETLNPTFRFYSFLECLIGNPQMIDNDTVYETWSITVPPAVLSRRVEDRLNSEEDPLSRPIRIVKDQSITFNLRCVHVTSKDTPLDKGEYSSNATYWPEHLFVSVNGTHLEFRRKIHHGIDLPVDITQLLIQEDNELTLSYHANSNEADKTLAVLVEAVVFRNHDAAVKLPQERDIGTCLATITQPIIPTSNGDDDDLVMTDQSVSIDLIDPFTARIFDTPVRGRDCRHRECFDLESYLQSRNCRNKDGVVLPGEWRCPTCGKDARPTSLVVDRFLLQVKDDLVSSSRAATRAILVREDGSWEPKIEPVTMGGAENKRKTTELRTGSEPTAAENAKSADESAMYSALDATEPEVIELVDDEDG